VAEGLNVSVFLLDVVSDNVTERVQEKLEGVKVDVEVKVADADCELLCE
jgi:hypothetical protein